MLGTPRIQRYLLRLFEVSDKAPGADNQQERLLEEP